MTNIEMELSMELVTTYYALLKHLVVNYFN